MIRIKIKVKNDHRSLAEDFEAEELNLQVSEEPLRGWIEKVIEDFGDPVDEVSIKTSQLA